MTWSTLAASGTGHIVLWLRIAGIKWILATEDLEPPAGDTWFWDGAARIFDDVKPWLRWGGMTIEERSSFLDGTMEVQGFPIEISDVGFTALIKSFRALAMTRLTQDLLTADVHAHVDDVSAFPAGGGTIYCGLETIGYDHTDAANEFHVLDRGMYGSIATDHEVDLTAFPVRIQPAVLDGPQVLGNRRADIFASTVDSAGQVSASECIFRGYMGQDVEAGQGVYKIQIEHISKMWSRKVGQWLPRTSLKPGYWYSGETSLCRIDIDERDMTATPPTLLSTTDPTQYYFTGGQYVSDGDLALQVTTDISTAQTAVGFTRPIKIVHDVDGKRYLGVDDDEDFWTTIRVRAGDPLWALGFDEGYYDFPPSSESRLIPAQREAVLFLMEATNGWESVEEPIFDVFDGGKVVDSQWFVLGPSSPAFHVESVAGNRVTVTGGSKDPRHHADDFVAIEDEKDLIFQHVIFFNGTRLSVVLEQLCGTLGTLPASWRLEGFRSGDISSIGGELADCLDNPATPALLQGVSDVIKEPITVAEYVCDRLGVLGICPRLIDDGVIGFARLKTPTVDDAVAVEVDSLVWDHTDARNVITQIEGEPLLNQIKINHSYDYTIGTWPPCARINYDDGRSIMGKTRCKVYNLRGVHIAVRDHLGGYADEAALIMDIASYYLGVFGVYGRVSPVIAIPSTWTSRQLLVGDVVLVSHPCIVDTTLGEIGVSDRVGIVVGKRHAVTSRQKDELLVQIPPETAAGRIAPCALATAWVAGTLTLSVPVTNIFCQTGDTDLTYFEKDYEAFFIEYNDAAPATFGPTTIASVGANSIVLDADPFGGAFPANGVLVVYASYDSCIAAQQTRWLFFGDAAYSLGAAADEARQWAI